MKILIIGAAGMVGRKLAEALLVDGTLRGEPVTGLMLADVTAPEAPGSDTVEITTHEVDIADPRFSEQLIAPRPDVIFHLAAIVSGQAEQDFDLGYAINMDGTRHLFEAIRAAGQAERYCPRVVYTSSQAVFGAPFPKQIGDEFFTTPLTSYGAQKAIGELLLADYSRRKFLDGVGIRLPTISIRPGKPNLAASGFFSSILREPLAGKEAVLPVDEDVRHFHVSPRKAVRFLRHGAEIDTAPMGVRRNLNMPGLSATVGEQIDGLRRIAGEDAVALIRKEPDPEIAKIVKGWPTDFDASRALALGFEPETSFDDIIQAHIEDEMGGTHT